MAVESWIEQVAKSISDVQLGVQTFFLALLPSLYVHRPTNFRGSVSNTDNSEMLALTFGLWAINLLFNLSIGASNISAVYLLFDWLVLLKVKVRTSLNLNSEVRFELGS